MQPRMGPAPALSRDRASADPPGRIEDIRPPEDPSLLTPRAFRPAGPAGFPAYPLSPAAWWLLGRVRHRLTRFPLFAPREYRRCHPGAAGYLPHLHYLHRGMYQTRPTATPVFFAKALAERLREVPPDTGPAPDIQAPSAAVGVYASSLGNCFMTEIADDLAASLAAAGARVIRGDERCSRAGRPKACIFVAPHEFFTLGRGPAWARPAVLCDAVLYGTEQPQTTWFWRALPLTLAARGAMDLSWHTAALLGQVMPSRALLPGLRPAPFPVPAGLRSHPLLAGAWWLPNDRIDPRTPLAERPLDLVFFGGDTPVRDRFFARNAARFAGYDTLIYLRKRGRGPVHPRNVEGDLCTCALLACGRAKLTLSVHRDAFGFFEWHRLVRQAMATGSVAVTESCFPVPDFRPGVHYFCADAGHLPQLIDWLLRTPDGRAQAESCRRRCLDLLSDLFSPDRAGRRILQFLAELGVLHA